MGVRAVVTMNAAEFFAWHSGQTGLYELVDGYPLKMMSGAGNRHDQITVNIIGEIRSRLRGKTCRPTTQDTGVKISETQIRRPDAAIDCGPLLDNSFIANDPRAVFEVLSPSTRNFDQVKKLEEYKSLASLRHILLIDPDGPELIAYTREANGAWTSRAVEGLEAEAAFPDLGFTLPLAEIYRGLTFRAKPAAAEGE